MMRAEHYWREHMGYEPDADDDYWRETTEGEQLPLFPLSDVATACTPAP